LHIPVSHCHAIDVDRSVICDPNCDL
jgi:hypothetical protein